MRKYIGIILFLFSTSAWAQSNLHLLKGNEWKGTCRKVVNEANKEIKKQPYTRLQSSYSFQNDELIWSVKSFKTTKCEKIYIWNKYTLNCGPTTKKPFANCKQTKWEESKDGTTWNSKPMVDYSGYPSIIELKVKVESTKKNKLKITTIGESEEPETEILTH